MTFKTLLMIGMTSAALVSCGNPKGADIPFATTQSPYFQSTDQIVTIDDVDIRLRDEGSKDTPAIIMVHGFTSSLETWDALAAELKSDYRIIRFDLPGHGLSGTDPANDYSNERTVALFSKLVGTLKLDNPVLLGNSLGGLVAWRTEANNTGTASKLILISPGGFSINGVTDKPVDVPMMVKFYLTKAPSAGVKQATTALYGDPSKLTEARIIEVGDMMAQPGNGDAFVSRAEQFTLPAPEPDLAKVLVPTLIIWGDKDIMVPVDQGPKFAAAMPNATLRTYEGVGHVPQEEATKRLAKDIREFLSDEVTP